MCFLSPRSRRYWRVPASIWRQIGTITARYLFVSGSISHPSYSQARSPSAYQTYQLIFGQFAQLCVWVLDRISLQLSQQKPRFYASISYSSSLCRVSDKLLRPGYGSTTFAFIVSQLYSLWLWPGRRCPSSTSLQSKFPQLWALQAGFSRDPDHYRAESMSQSYVAAF